MYTLKTARRKRRSQRETKKMLHAYRSHKERVETVYEGFRESKRTAKRVKIYWG
jgi:hypothetical protein